MTTELTSPYLKPPLTAASLAAMIRMTYCWVFPCIAMKSSHSEENADPQKENKAPNIYRMKSSEDAPKISALTRQPQETIPKSLPRNLDVDNKAESDEPPVLPVKSRNSPSIENGGKGEEIKSYPEHVGDEEFWKGL